MSATQIHFCKSSGNKAVSLSFSFSSPRKLCKKIELGLSCTFIITSFIGLLQAQIYTQVTTNYRNDICSFQVLYRERLVALFEVDAQFIPQFVNALFGGVVHDDGFAPFAVGFAGHFVGGVESHL